MSENSAEEKAREQKSAHEEARQEMEEFQERDDLPSDLSEWPDGKAKYITFDNDSGVPYGEGLTEKLGPPVVHHEDGSVSVNGEKVDNPEDYKGEKIELATQIGDPDQVEPNESNESNKSGE